MNKKITITVDPDLADLIPGFLENRQNEIQKIIECIEAEDFTELSNIGHTLKGLGSSYGFDRLSDFGQQLEQLAKMQESKDLRLLVEKMIDYLSALEIIYPGR